MIKAVIFDCFGVVIDVFRGTKRDGILSLIKSLKPNHKLALLTNVSGRESLERRFEPGELDALFDVVVASGDVGFQKPAPEIYQMTAEKLGVSPTECIFIDDIEEFVTAAERIGMHGIYHVDDETTRTAVMKYMEE